jgi:type I restriction enzyme S subunit
MRFEKPHAIDTSSLAACLESLESGGRPEGGGTTAGEIPSEGAEHLNDSGSFDFESIKFIPRDYYERMFKGRVRPNDILIVKDGATTGKTAFVNGDFPYEEAAVNEHVFIVRTKSDILFPRYAFFFLHSDYGKQLILRDFRGSAQGGITRGFVEKIQTPLPPLPIQKQIAAILEKADAAREKRQQANQLTKQFLESAFLEMFGDPVRNPKRWKVVRLGEILTAIDSGKSPVCLKRPAAEDEWGVLKLGAVTPGWYSDTENKALPAEVKPDEQFEVRVGDLLLVRKNTYELVGRTALVLSTRRKLLLSDLTFRLVVMHNLVAAEYLWYTLNNKSIQARIQNLSGGSAGSMPNVSKERLKTLSLPVPSLPLQQQFASIVHSVESLRTKQRESEKELENLFNSLMQRAFRGELVG